jgi:uncharacterized protein (TIGR02246 family)
MDEQQIRQLLEHDYAAAIGSGDLDRYVSLYDDDVIWSIPNAPDVKDRDGIRRVMGGVLQKVSQEVDISIDDLSVIGEHAVVLAVARGTATPHGTDEVRSFVLRVMWALRRGTDGWLINRQVGTPKPDTS